MDKKFIAIGALAIIGMALASLRAGFDDGQTDKGPDFGQKKPLAPHEELAAWLLREGRMRLKRGQRRQALEAAVLAGALDSLSGHEALASAVEVVRTRIAEEIKRTANDAREAGSVKRYERLNSSAENLK